MQKSIRPIPKLFSTLQGPCCLWEPPPVPPKGFPTIPWPEGTYNPSWEYWIKPWASTQLTLPIKPQKGGNQEAS